jgi:AsmA protein
MTESDATGTRRTRVVLMYALILAASSALLLVAAAAYLIATFDANDYRDALTRLAKDRTGRTLHIGGGISLSFWPPVGVRIGKLSLSERESDEAFASMESARVQVEVLPLFSHEIVASELVLTGATIHVVRYQDGRLNVDDLLGGEGRAPHFDVRAVKVERSLLSYTDRGSKTTYELADLTFSAPRLATTVETPIELAFTVREADTPLHVRAKVQGRLGMDVQARRYALAASIVELDGHVGKLPQFTAALKGDVVARADTKELEVTGVTSSLSGGLEDQELTITLDASKLLAHEKRVRGENLRGTFDVRGRAATMALKFTSPSLTLEDERIRLRDTGLEISFKRDEHDVRAALTAGIEAHIAARAVTLVDMRSQFHVSGPGLPRHGLAGAATGSARVDRAGETVQLAISGTVGESKLQARLKASGFSAPVYVFNVSIDELDLDRYMTNMADPKRKAPAASAPGSLLDPLANLRATGTVMVGRLKSGGISARNVRFDIK